MVEPVHRETVHGVARAAVHDRPRNDVDDEQQRTGSPGARAARSRTLVPRCRRRSADPPRNLPAHGQGDDGVGEDHQERRRAAPGARRASTIGTCRCGRSTQRSCAAITSVRRPAVPPVRRHRRRATASRRRRARPKRRPRRQRTSTAPATASRERGSGARRQVLAPALDELSEPAGVHAEARPARRRRGRTRQTGGGVVAGEGHVLDHLAAHRGVAACGAVRRGGGEQAGPERHGRAERARPGERAAAHHRHDVAERGELLVGAHGVVVRLHRHEAIAGRRGQGAPPRASPASSVSASRNSRWVPRARSAPTAQAHGLPSQPTGGSVVTTVAPCRRATSAVWSSDESSTTIISSGGGSRASSEASRRGSVAASLRAGTTTDTVTAPAPPPRRDRGARTPQRRQSGDQHRPRRQCDGDDRDERRAHGAPSADRPTTYALRQVGMRARPRRRRSRAARSRRGSRRTGDGRPRRIAPTPAAARRRRARRTCTGPRARSISKRISRRHASSTVRRCGSAPKRSRSACGT